MNSRSLTEVELITFDDNISKAMCAKIFTGAQGFTEHFSVVFQDDTSTIKLAENGKLSSG